MTTVRIEIDQLSEAAYLQFNDHAVVRTIEIDENTNVDLDEFGMAVGIEVFGLARPIPLDLIDQHVHVDSEAMVLLKYLAHQPIGSRVKSTAHSSAVKVSRTPTLA